MVKHIFKGLNLHLNQRGFSLIEIMIVTAIIGILATIAVPNYKHYQRKSRQAGGKIELSNMFTSERTFISAWGYGTSCMGQLEYKDSNDPFYNVGWSPTSGTGALNAANGSPPASYQGPSCAATPAYSSKASDAGTLAEVKSGSKGYIAIANNDAAFGGNPLKIPGEDTNDRFYKITFTIGAIGYIGGNVADAWTITHQKTLENTQSGL